MIPHTFSRANGGWKSPCDGNTKLLVRSDSITGNTNFEDISPSRHSVTAAGNTQHTEITDGYPLTGFGNTSIFIDSIDTVTQSLVVGGKISDWDFGSGDFTIDFWARFTYIKAYAIFLACMPMATGASGWVLRMNNLNGLRLDYSDGAVKNKAVTGYYEHPVNNSWDHLAVTKSGTDLRFYVNGTQIGTTQTLTETISASAENLVIGGGATGSYPQFKFGGYLDEIRISNVARWTGTSFTVPTAPYCAG